MTEQLPDPFVPPEVDLRDFAFMPLDVRRLRDSALITERSAEEIVAALLLWAASWHQIPASSLPDDDRQLAALAGYGRAVREFVRVKDGAMHRFIRCSDGRWYHAVIAEKAAEGWNAKLKEEHKRECDRIRKENKARDSRNEPPLPIPGYPQLLSVRHVDGIPCWRLWGSNGNSGYSDGNEDDSDGTDPLQQRKSRLKGSEGKLRDREVGVDLTSPHGAGAGQGQNLLKKMLKTGPEPADIDRNREIARRLASGEVVVGGKS